MHDQNKKKLITQIVYRDDCNEYVIGWIAKFYDAPEKSYAYKWSIDGITWSSEYIGYDKAIRKLLVKTGHKKADHCRIIPKPEQFLNLWIYPRNTVL